MKNSIFKLDKNKWANNVLATTEGSNKEMINQIISYKIKYLLYFVKKLYTYIWYEIYITVEINKIFAPKKP